MPPTTIQPVFDTVEIGFDTLPGLDYALESSLDFVGWQTATNTAGDGALASFEVPATNACSFFRLRLEPAQ